MTTPFMTSWIIERNRIPDDSEACWEWVGPTRKGYGRVMLGGRYYSVHRIVYADIHGPIPEGIVVMHTCDNPPCFNPAHLKPGTQAENMADMRAKGRNSVGSPFEEGHEVQPDAQQRARGDRHGVAKMTGQMVSEIRDAYHAGGVTQKELAVRFGVHQSNISRALSGKLWTHI